MRRAHGDIRPLCDVLEDVGQVKKLVQHQVGTEVERRVEEREETQHAPEADDGVPPAEPAKRRDGERDREKTESPDAGLVGDDLDGIRAKLSPDAAENEACEGHHGGGEHHGLYEAPEL